MFRRNFLKSLGSLLPVGLLGCHVGVKHQTEFKVAQKKPTPKFAVGDRVKRKNYTLYSEFNQTIIGIFIIHSGVDINGSAEPMYVVEYQSKFNNGYKFTSHCFESILSLEHA